MSSPSSPAYRQGGERVSSPPGLCTTYEGHNTEYLEHILPFVEYIEVTPDAMAQYKNEEIILHETSLADLKSLGANTRIIVHGVGLSIGSYEGYSQYYIRLLDTLFEQLNVSWHSEHLAYTTVNGEHLGTMLALPKTDQVLDMICERVSALQTRYGLPFLLENVVHLLPDFPGTYSEAGFLNALTERTGCGLLLDVYNLECDAQNNKFDINAFYDPDTAAPGKMSFRRAGFLTQVDGWGRGGGEKLEARRQGLRLRRCPDVRWQHGGAFPGDRGHASRERGTGRLAFRWRPAGAHRPDELQHCCQDHSPNEKRTFANLHGVTSNRSFAHLYSPQQRNVCSAEARIVLRFGGVLGLECVDAGPALC